MKQRAIEDLQAGKTARLKAHGNSMVPLIKSGATLTLEPIELTDVKVGDIVMCRVRGNIYDAHLVTALKGGEDNRSVQISNNHGKVNGWTRTVYGLVTKVEGP